MKRLEYFDQPSYYYVIKKNPVPWSYLYVDKRPYVCKPWSLTVRGERILAFVNKAPEIIGVKTEEVAEKLR
jgi:hypothetical protein